MEGMFLIVVGGRGGAGPNGIMAHFSKLGCSLEIDEKESIQRRVL